MDGNNRIRGKRRGITTHLLILGSTVGLCFILLPACSPKIVEKVRTEVQYRDRTIHDTAYFRIPYFVERIVTRDTSSHLENPYAKSDAVVSNGYLSHSLESVPQVIKVPYEVHVTDTVYKEAATIVETKYVEKELSWWQNLRIKAFWWLLVAVLGLLVWTFRKPILALLKKFI